jgi:hypothetical protein
VEPAIAAVAASVSDSVAQATELVRVVPGA